MKHPRRKKLINPSLQLKLTGALISMACLAVLFQVFLFNRTMLTIAREVGELDGLLMAQLPGIMRTNVGLMLVVMLPLMFYVGVVLTHRIAGPAYRMEVYLRELADGGDPGVPCSIRQGDELSSLCDALNQAVARLNEERTESGASSAGGVEEHPEPAGLLPGCTPETSDACASDQPGSSC